MPPHPHKLRRQTYENLDCFQLDDGRVMVTLGVPDHRIPEEFVPADRLEESEREWSAYAVTLNRRFEALLALAKRRGVDDEAIRKAVDIA